MIFLFLEGVTLGPREAWFSASEVIYSALGAGASPTGVGGRDRNFYNGGWVDSLENSCVYFLFKKSIKNV